MKQNRDSITLKSAAEIEQMRAAGRVVAATLDACERACRPGVTTRELDDIALKTFSSLGATGLFFGYPDYQPRSGYPRHTCISVNEEIVHGIPGDRIIRDGDLVSIDCGVRLNGWCADSARSIAVGNASSQARRLVDVTSRALALAIDAIRPGMRWSAIGSLLEDLAESERLGIIREYVGHGIGRSMHESPKVPNYRVKSGSAEDFLLRPGLVIAIEPMLTLGTGQTLTLRDGWTVVTRDRRLAAHQEHTVAVTAEGADILTLA